LAIYTSNSINCVFAAFWISPSFHSDCIAQALLGAEKAPIVRLVTLRCALPYALEGMVRRELRMTFALTEPAVASLITKLNEAGHGRMRWLEVDEAA